MKKSLEVVINIAVNKTHITLILGSTNDKDNIEKTGEFVLEASKRYYSQLLISNKYQYNTYVHHSDPQQGKKWGTEVVEFPYTTFKFFPHPLNHRNEIKGVIEITPHEAFVAIAHLARFGNCGLHAHLVADYLWQWQCENKENLLINSIEIVELEGDHTIVLINRNQDSSLDQPDEWGIDCYVVDAWKGSHSHYDWEQISEEKKPKKHTIYIQVEDNTHLKYSLLKADGNLAEGIIELNEVLSQVENEMFLNVKKIEQIISRNGHRSYFYPASLFKKAMERNNTSQIERIVDAINPSVDIWSDSWRRWDMLPAADIKMLGEDGEFILRTEIEMGLREHRNKMAGFFKSLNEKSSQQEYPVNAEFTAKKH